MASLAMGIGPVLAAKPGGGGQPTIIHNRDLQFGTIALKSASGTVTVTTSGIRTCSANVTCLGANAQSGEFEIRGNAAAVTISVSTSILLTSAQNNQVSVSLTPSTTSMTLQSGNNKNFVTVGGVLNITTASQGGTYNGSYLITVDYL